MKIWIKIYRRLNIFGIFLYDTFLFSLNKNKRDKTADLLLIKVDAIGDYIIWQDSLRAYKRKYKNKKVILLCNIIVREIAMQDPFFSEVWGLDNYRFRYDVKYYTCLVKLFNSVSFQDIISPVYSRENYVDKIVHLVSGNNKIGYVGNFSNITPKQQVRNNHFYTRLIENSSDISEIEKNAHFVKEVCDKSFVSNLPLLDSLTLDKKILGDLLFCVFSISASYSPRAWNIKSFAEIANSIPDEYKIVLLGNGLLDIQKGQDFIRGINNSGRIINLIDKTSILDFIRIISQAAFVLGNDSAAVHIAAARRVPSICIAPGAHYNRFVPYPKELPDLFYHPRVVVYNMPCFGCDYRCKYPINGELECIRRVTQAMVIEELNRLLMEIKK